MVQTRSVKKIADLILLVSVTLVTKVTGTTVQVSKCRKNDVLLPGTLRNKEKLGQQGGHPIMKLVLRKKGLGLACSRFTTHVQGR